jgi:hypothetical protein
MKLLFLDDSRQPKCQRQRLGPLVAVGGIAIDEASARQLDTSINDLSRQYGFPEGQVFKWSPSDGHWMKKNLVEPKRQQFFNEVLNLAAKSGAVAQVMVSDSDKKPPTPIVAGHEMGVLALSLERFNKDLGNQERGMVIVARPSGDRKDEDKFLAQCAEMVSTGTNYVGFRQLISNVVTMPFDNSRLLQVADLGVSITSAMVAGNIKYAGTVFPSVRAILRRSPFGHIGGWGVKIHPDFNCMNLYRWVLDDTNNNGTLLPLLDRPYPKNGQDFY